MFGVSETMVIHRRPGLDAVSDVLDPFLAQGIAQALRNADTHPKIAVGGVDRHVIPPGCPSGNSTTR
jgi:hypothetical protein